MYIERRRIGKEIYNYLKLSVRYKDKVRTKTIAYLGKGSISKKELEKISAEYKTKIRKIRKNALKDLKTESGGASKFFFSEEQLLKIEEINKKFSNKLKRLDKKTKEDMFNDFITLYSYNTNAIEGNTLTLRDTDLLLNKGIAPQGKTLREINDHLNAKEVFNFILENKPKIIHETIIELHAILMENIDKRTGGYRTHNVRVFGATFETTPAEYVKIDMNLLLRWYRKNKTSLHPLILAAVFHQKFERIHPFYDGNGRTGRMLLNLILLQNNIPPLIVPNAQRKRYYKALSSADKTRLDEIQSEHKEIAAFCYFCLLKTHNTLFSRWG